MESEQALVAAPSVAYGGALEPGGERTLGQALLAAAERAPAARLVVVRADGSERSWSYREVAERAGGRGQALQRAGLAPGARVLLQLTRPEDFLDAFWGCVLHGFVPVPLPAADDFDDDGPAATRLWHAWSKLGQPLVLVDASTAPRVLDSARRRALDGLRSLAIEGLTGELPRGFVPVGTPDDVTLLLLTSGSTGASKAVRLTHANLLAMNAGTARLKGLGPADTTLNWMPLDHVGALVFLGTMPVHLGASQVHVATSFVIEDPLRWLGLLSRHRVAVSWAPNFAFGLVNELAPALVGRDLDLSALRCLANGGEAVVPATVLRFLDALAPFGLRGDALQPAFGMSETSSVITWAEGLRPELSPGSPHASVGPPIPGAWLRITDAHDEPVPEGQIGRLQVKGPAIFQGYEGDPEATARAMRAGGWFDTGDLGFLRQGRLTITGREKDTIIVNGRNYFNHEIEAVAEGVAGVAVSFAGACAVRRPGQDTEELALFVSAADDTLESAGALAGALRERVLQRIGLHAAHVVPLRKHEFPKTGIGKVQRAELRRRFESGAYASRLPAAEPAGHAPGRLRDALQRRVFRRKRGVARGARRPQGTTLVLLDRAGLGAAFAAELRRRGWPVWTHDAAPSQATAYARLREEIAAHGLPPPSDVLCAWPADLPHEATRAADLLAPLDDAVERLLALLNGLPDPARPETVVRLWLATRGAQAVEEDELEGPAGAALVALALVAGQEQLAWRTRCVDLGPRASVAADAALLWDEFQLLEHDQEVAYRRGARRVPRLVPVSVRAPLAGDHLWLPPGSLALVTGGLGGIGRHLCAELLRRGDARLLVVGRRSASEAEAVLGRLDPGGQRLHYVQADVADSTAMAAAVAAARARWGLGVHAIFHLAADAHERLLAETARSDWERAARAKVHGSAVLHELAQAEPVRLYVAWSSVHSLLGGFQVGAYAAAGRALDALARRTSRLPGVRGLLLWFTRWEQVGMGAWAAGEEQAAAQGLRSVTVGAGLASLVVALAQPHERLLVGLEPRGALRLAFDAQEPEAGAWRLVCSGAPLPESGLAELARQSGLAPEDVRWEHQASLPRGADGRVDRARLEAGPARSLPGAERAAARTETEARLLALWRELLRSDDVGVLDKFFEVGGNSLKSVRLVAGILETFQCRLAVGELFRHNTVRAQARRIDELLAGGAETERALVQVHEF